MRATRRTFTLALAAGALAACAGGGAPGPLAARAPAPEPQFLPAPNPAFDAWLAGFRARAQSRGIAPATLDRALAGAGFLPGVVERDRNQTEFTRTTEDYLSIAASDERIAKGRAALSRYSAVLSAIDDRYGVKRRTWWWPSGGWRASMANGSGSVPVSRPCRRWPMTGGARAFMEQQLIAALKILQNGDITPAQMTGSWAGAMGHTQFIPTSYLAFAVDFNGDGRRDIWSADPTDSLASTAAYLSRNGWRRGQPWGLEVTRPAGLAAPGRGGRAQRGRLARGGRAGGGRRRHPRFAGPASLIAPAGPNGPSFLLFRNFNVILTYNNAQNYALGVGYLSDRLAGGGPIRGSFPPDAQGLTKADRQEMQRRLTAAGFDTQGTDGVIGNNTRAAISAYQAAAGLPVTGEPSLRPARPPRRLARGRPPGPLIG
jgi:membrane-bound lytic murein transglycosylase B